MTHRSRQTVLVVFPLALGLWACGATKSQSPGPNPVAQPEPEAEEMVVMGHAPSNTTTATETVPADAAKSPDLPRKLASPITRVETEKKEQDATQMMGGVPDGSVKTGQVARGTSLDPLANLAQGDRASGGEGAAIAAAPAPPPPGATAYGSMAQAGDWNRYAGGHGQGTVGAASEMRGTIARAEIQRVVKEHLSDVQRCYEQGLTRQPNLEGRLVVKFVVAKTGTVAAVAIPESTLGERSVEQCIVGAAMKWTFPKPTGEGLATFTYPFILKPGN